LQVLAIESAEKATNPKRFANRRAEMWWKVRERMIDRDLPYPEEAELRSQLSSVRYEPVDSTGGIKIESKKEIKKRIHRSPDRADCYVYGIWTMERYEPIHPKHTDYEYDNEIEEQMAHVRGY